MILRPSKIFVSFHQLRHYFQQKISELVVSSHPQPSHTVTQLANFSTTQQSILFFSDINRTLIQKAYFLQQPVKRNPINEKLLLQVIQRHFPIVKVFSQPTLHGRVWASSTHPTQQLRTMMSSSGGNGGGTAFMTWGFPRTAMVGVGRTNNGFAATRQFSTNKAPTCVNLFQNSAPQQPNVFTHVSSRIFTPAGTKMNQQPTASDERPNYVPFYSLEKDLSSDEESVCSNSSSSGDFHNYNRIFQQKSNKGMGDLVDNNYEPSEKHHYVRRESATTGNSGRNNKRPSSMKRLDSIIHHDDISSLHTTGGNVSNKRKLQHTSSRHGGRTKHPPPLMSPPDHLHHVKRKEDTTKRKITHSGVPATAATSVYLLVTLDTTPFLSTWSTQSLDSSFIDSVETIANNYQLHIDHVLNLLDRLRYSGKKFRVVVRSSELRIYFPSANSIQSKFEAIEFLKRINVDQDENYYTIIVEDQSDYFSLDHHATATTAPVVGPDYFKDLQMFLDRTDYLIETSSSAFGSAP